MDDVKGRCSQCMKSPGRDLVRTCPNCRLVRYCSRGCQRAAWPQHKKCCNDSVLKTIEQTKDKHLANLLSDLSKWTNEWRDSLRRWGFFAMNLPNSPEDRLATHVFVVELERRRNPPTKFQKFEMIGGGVMTRETVSEMLIEMGMPKKNYDSWKEDHRGNHTLQILIIAEGMQRLLWMGAKDATTGNTILVLEEEDKDTSYVLAQFWGAGLKAAIHQGETTRAGEYLNLCRERCKNPEFVEAVRNRDAKSKASETPEPSTSALADLTIR